MKKTIWLILIIILICPSIVSAKTLLWQKSYEDNAGTKGAAKAWFSATIHEVNNSIEIDGSLICGKRHGGTMNAKGTLTIINKDKEVVYNKIFSCSAGGGGDGGLNKSAPDKEHTTLFGYTKKNLLGGQFKASIIAKQKDAYDAAKASIDDAIARMTKGVGDGVEAIIKAGGQAVSVLIK